MRRLIVGAAALLALSPFIALASASTPAGAAVAHPAASASAATHGSATHASAVVPLDITASICQGDACVAGVADGSQYYVAVGDTTIFVRNCSHDGGVQGPLGTYCEIHQDGNNRCLNWFSGSNTVQASNCDGTNPNQHWYWDSSAGKFYNYGATKDDVNAVMYVTANEHLDLASPSHGNSTFTWG